AGIRKGHDQIERIGVDFSLKRLEEAEAALVVLDGSSPLSMEDRSVLRAVKEKKGLVVINKNDLPQELDIRQVVSAAPGKEMVSVSAKEGKGLDALRLALRKLLLDAQSEPPIVVTNARHKAALERAEESLTEAVKVLKGGFPPEIVAVELQEAKEGLEEVIGVVTNDNILERIFSQFCIGK
ncbi:MAG: tRNA uridine-5-carboxymethylaminomethyl(34) synthesis GTPase MnmE, partial [Candidatus Binatia bacterium]